MKPIFGIILLIGMQSCNTVTTKPGNENENKLAGSWKVVADQLLDSSYHVIDQDTNIAGLIIYMPDGKMSAQILWKGIRSPIMTDSIMQHDNAATATLGLGFNTWTFEQTRKLIDTYDSYFGNYTVDWKTNIVTHIMTGNLRPEKEGTVYKRIFKLKGDSLFLRSKDPASRWQVACVRNL